MGKEERSQVHDFSEKLAVDLISHNYDKYIGEKGNTPKICLLGWQYYEWYKRYVIRTANTTYNESEVLGLIEKNGLKYAGCRIYSVLNVPEPDFCMFL